MPRIRKVTVELEDGTTQTYTGYGRIETVGSETKQDTGPSVPVKYIDLHMEIK